jgi:hypothetical protein
LEASDFAFGVVDRSDFEGCRIYLGPDFIGAGVEPRYSAIA